MYTLCPILVITLNEDDKLKKKMNKHPQFDESFDIQHQLEHFEYVMIHALNNKLFGVENYICEVYS